MERDRFRTRTGFIIACIGSAVGMGNIWRFPIMVSKYGGMTFFVVYILFVILIASSGMIEEFALGRWAEAGPVGAFGKCTKERFGKQRVGEAIGALPVLGAMGERHFFVVTEETHGVYARHRPSAYGVHADFTLGARCKPTAAFDNRSIPFRV